MTDKRFQKSLRKAKEKFEAHFENATEVYMDFMTDPYVTERMGGHPYSIYLTRYFTQRALAYHGITKKRPEYGYKKLMRGFGEVSAGDEIKRPTKKKMRKTAESHIKKLVLKPEYRDDFVPIAA